jgi:hypothetical protein
MKRYGFLALLLASTLLFALVSIMTPGGVPANAAPQAAPTPVSVNRGDTNWLLRTMFDGAVLTADRRSGCVETASQDLADIQFTIEQGADINTTTLTLQHTNDAETFVDGVDVTAQNITNSTVMTQMQLFGWQTCILANVTNTNPVTITVKALFK